MQTKEILTDNELLQANGGTTTGSVNWLIFGDCIRKHGGDAIPALAEMVRAIRSKDWSRVAVLVNNPAIAALPIVAEALATARA